MGSHASEALHLPSRPKWLLALLLVVPVLRLPALRGCCVQVKMVTGDQKLIAIETCRRLGMGTNIMAGPELTPEDAALAAKVTEVDGFAGVYPEHKHCIVAALQSKGHLVGMTGVLAPLHGVHSATGTDADARRIHQPSTSTGHLPDRFRHCLQVTV